MLSPGNEAIGVGGFLGGLEQQVPAPLAGHGRRSAGNEGRMPRPSLGGGMAQWRSGYLQFGSRF